MNGFKEEHREQNRFQEQKQISFYFTYDFQTPMKVQGEQEKKKTPPVKYPAMSKNVSAEGLCFTSYKELRAGDTLMIEVYLLNEKNPIHLEGQVRWSCLTSSEKDEEPRFDTGVKLKTVEGQPIHNTVYYDEQYHVIWSAALESILGKFRLLSEKRN